MENKNVNDFTKKCLEQHKSEIKEFILDLDKSAEIANDFVEKLPDDVGLALSTISSVIDFYAYKIGQPSHELWHRMNEASLFVHEQLGDYGEDQE